MKVSCKVSHSVIVFVEHQEIGLDPFFENFKTPVEFLKDPSCWIPIREMESFLSEMKGFLKLQDARGRFREMGQNNFELRTWGVLDSVLKMLESPKEIFSRPDRFLSYFLTPHLQLEIKKHKDNQVEFCLERKWEAPLVFSYLMGALEGLPKYMGLSPARIIEKEESCFQILWSGGVQEPSLFNEQEEKRRQLHPEIVHSVIQSLVENLGDRQQKGNLKNEDHIIHEAFEKMVAVEVEKRMIHWMEKKKDFHRTFVKIKDDFYKMYDYFVRAQQIIALISPSARKASVREAMRRVDWDHVQEEFPKMVENTCDSILSIKDSFNGKGFGVSDLQSHGSVFSPEDSHNV